MASLEDDAPVLVNIRDRRESIMANTPGVFVVEPNPGAMAHPNPIYAIGFLEEVTINRSVIDALAGRYDLDPDFVRAIVWIESTHGWYDRFTFRNHTLRPMNVHDTLWSQLGVDRKALTDRKLNIAAGVHILAAIWERTLDPTVEKVATLYNQLGATQVNNYGKTVAQYMVHKPWSAAVKAANTFPLPCSGCHRK
jgi:hypothetical protein